MKKILIFIILLFFTIVLKNQTEHFNNFENNFTICIKTIYRSNLLKENIKSIRKIYPNVQIIIADDSDDEYKIKNKMAIQEASKNDKNITYIPLPYDTGLSKGRNECVKRVKTDFTILTDDSRFIESENDVIQNIIKYMGKNNVKLVTGSIKDRNDSNYICNFDYCMNENRKRISNDEIKKIMKGNGTIILKKKKINNISKFGKLEFQGINMGVNCFIAKTNTLKNNKWDENKGPHGDRKGNTEHEDFFFRLWLKNINIKYCKHFYFKQANEILRKYDKNGKNLRKRKFDKSNIYKLLIQ
jgi:hypothetical protein